MKNQPAELSDAELRARIAAIHELVFAHFVAPDTNLLRTRLAKDLSATLPPRAMLEDTSLCGGMYLAALVDRWEVTREPAHAQEARRIFSGLVGNATVAGVPGYIVRGRSADGKTLVRDPSADQYTGLLYGLWRLHRSELATADDRDAIRRIFADVLARLERDGFLIREPGGEVTTFGKLSAVAPTRAERLLSFLLAARDVTGDEHWLDVYDEMKAQRLAVCKGYNRAKYASWVLVQSQISLQMCLVLAPGEDRPVFRAAMLECARNALPQIAAYRQLLDADLGDTALDDRDADRLLLRAARIPMDATSTVLLAEDPELSKQTIGPLRQMAARFPFEGFRDSRALAPMEWNYWMAVRQGLLER